MKPVDAIRVLAHGANEHATESDRLAICEAVIALTKAVVVPAEEDKVRLSLKTEAEALVTVLRSAEAQQAKWEHILKGDNSQ